MVIAFLDNVSQVVSSVKETIGQYSGRLLGDIAGSVVDVLGGIDL